MVRSKRMALAAIPIRSGRRLTRHSQTLLIPMGQIAGCLGEPECARFCSGLVRRGVCRRTSANAPRRRKAGFPQIGCPKLRPELRLAASAFDATPSGGRSNPNGISAGQSLFPAGGGCGIRTREGLNPTRFPSLPAASQSGSDHTARLRLQAWQPIMNPAERSRMRLKLRLALRLGWRDRGVNLNAVVVEAVGKEHWDRSHDPREAMVGGLAHSGRVIFAAGAVMVTVFLTFALSGPLPPKELGIILGIPVLLDALLVRLMLVPILLRLTGRTAWWRPRWLDRLLSDVRFGH